MQSAGFVPGARVIGQDGRLIGKLMTLGERSEELLLGIMLDHSEQVVHVPGSQIDTLRSTCDTIFLHVLMERPSRVTAALRRLRRVFSAPGTEQRSA